MSFKVMNNNDLRRIILSYFRDKPEVVCCSCKKVCIWEKKIIRKYTEIPTRDYTVIYKQCLECHRRAQTRDIFGR
jgi:hypothetical protein